MRLSEAQTAMRDGSAGSACKWAIEDQIKAGTYLGAADFVAVSQAHIMADTESLGVAGVEWLEQLAASGARVRIPTITDPRGTDFAAAHRLKHTDWMLDLERRTIAAFQTMGVLMTDTCINYQTIMPALRNEHMAYGDTGVVIYSNSVLGARSNFEGGPSALAAGLTGLTPRYGFHLPEHRRASLLIDVGHTPEELTDWGALGGIAGRMTNDYWRVPALRGIDRVPTSDELKHFGAAMASYGSVALFHMIGITPEAERLSDVADPGMTPAATITRDDIVAFRQAYAHEIDTVDVVVFSSPQLSLLEMRTLAGMLNGRQASVPLLVVTSPQVKPDSDRLGLTATMEAAGALVLSGMCFYQSYAREMAEANGWRALATNSAKLTNILGGYGYRPALLSMADCVDAAVLGRIKR